MCLFIPNRALVTLGISAQTPTDASNSSNPTTRAKSFQTRLNSGTLMSQYLHSHRKTRSSMDCRLLLALYLVHLHLQVSPNSTPSPIYETSSNLVGFLLPPTSGPPGSSPQGIQGWTTRILQGWLPQHPMDDPPNQFPHSEPYQQARRIFWHRACKGHLRQSGKTSKQPHVALPLRTLLLQGWKLSLLQGWLLCPHGYLTLHRPTCLCKFPLHTGPNRVHLLLP
jgi:hypothetical protein